MVLYVIAGAFLVAGGGPLMVYLDPSSLTGLICGLTILIAIGTGISMRTGYTVTTLTLKPQDVGGGLSMQNVSQIGGQVIALAIAGQIYPSTAARKLSAVLAGKNFSTEEIHGAVAGVQSTFLSTLDGELRGKVILAVAQAMQITSVLVPVAEGVMLLAAFCMKRERVFTKTTVAAGG